MLVLALKSRISLRLAAVDMIRKGCLVLVLIYSGVAMCVSCRTSRTRIGRS